MQHEEGLEFDAYKNDENEDDGNEGTVGYNILDPENVDEQYDYEDYGYGDDYWCSFQSAI